MKQVIKWMEEAHIVTGVNRECVYDNPRGTHYLVSNGFSELVKKIEGKDRDSLEESLSTEEIEWVEFMEEKELIMLVPMNTYQLFPAVQSGFETANFISNAIVEYGIHFNKSLTLLDQLFCRHIEIKINLLSELEIIIEQLQESNFQGVDIELFDSNLSLNKLKELIEGNSIIGNVIVPKLDEVLTFNLGSTRLIARRERDYYKPMFISNEAVFFESEENNPFFNKKLSIDRNGEVSLYSDHQILGNVCNLTLSSVLEQLGSNDVKSLWNTPKDKIDICNTCEFRRMCLDNRIPSIRQDFNNSVFYESECSYNPFISLWKEDEGYKTLAEVGVTCSAETYKVDYAKLNSVRNQIWG